MNRKIVLISSLSLGLLISVTTLAMLTFHNHSSKVTVTFVNSEASNGQFPNYLKSERLAFAVRNAGSQRASFYVCEIEDERGNWVPSSYNLGHVEAGHSDHIYLYLPLGLHPQNLRMRMLSKASTVRKTQYALRLLIEKASGRYPGKQFWFDGLEVPTCEFILKLDKEAE
jgi:hypothetical protein